MLSEEKRAGGAASPKLGWCVILSEYTDSERYNVKTMSPGTGKGE